MKHQDLIKKLQEITNLLEHNRQKIESSKYNQEYLDALEDLWMITEDIHNSMFEMMNNN